VPEVWVVTTWSFAVFVRPALGAGGEAGFAISVSLRAGGTPEEGGEGGGNVSVLASSKHGSPGLKMGLGSVCGVSTAVVVSVAGGWVGVAVLVLFGVRTTVTDDVVETGDVVETDASI